MADWRVATLKARGYPVTKSNLDLLGAWHAMEGGGDHNAASFNPLNTTRNAPGAVRSINSVGVKAFDTFDHGVNATVSTLDNYHTISEYLKAGKGADALRDPNGQADFNMWVSGKHAPGASPYVTRIAGLLGVDVGNAKVGKTGQSYGGGANPQVAQQKVADAIGAQKQMTAGFLMQAAHDTIAGGQPLADGNSLLGLAQARQQMQQEATLTGNVQAATQPDGAAAAPTQSVKGDGSWTFDFAKQATGGKGADIGNPYQGTHNPASGAAGANWQSDNAYDVGVPIGTPIYALGDGVVGDNFGRQPSRPKDGIRAQVGKYWYGHLSHAVVKPGQKVRAGQLIGYSGASANGVAHLHVGYEG